MNNKIKERICKFFDDEQVKIAIMNMVKKSIKKSKYEKGAKKEIMIMAGNFFSRAFLPIFRNATFEELVYYVFEKELQHFANIDAKKK